MAFRGKALAAAWMMLGLGLMPSCGGEEFGDGGGSDAGAGTGGTGAGGTSGSAGSTAGTGGSTAGAGGTAATGGTSSGGTDAGGAAGSDAGSNCSDELYQLICTDPLVTTGTPACDTCGHEQCCDQANNCLANASCAAALSCYLKNCLGQPATTCIGLNCSNCADTGVLLSLFLPLSSCLQSQCGPVCPDLVQ